MRILQPETRSQLQIATNMRSGVLSMCDKMLQIENEDIIKNAFKEMLRMQLIQIPPEFDMEESFSGIITVICYIFIETEYRKT